MIEVDKTVNPAPRDEWDYREGMDWDDVGENSDYLHVCTRCDKRFIGHKRRWICKLCDKDQRDLKEGNGD